jgi:hypothetical protein
MGQRVGPVTADGFKPGDYVFACKYSDADPNDPWYVGFILCIVIFKEGCCVIMEGDATERKYKWARHLTREEGDKIILQSS